MAGVQMHVRFVQAIAFAAVALAASCGLFGPASAAAPPPTSAFGALPQLESVAIAPDGSAIAYIGQIPTGRALVIQSLAGGQDVVVPFAGGKVRDVEWAANDVAIVTASIAVTPPDGDPGRFGKCLSNSEY